MKRGKPGEGYEAVIESDLRIGDEVILERRRFEYKTGAPVDSEYFRAIVGEHNTVAGPRKHLVNEPTVAFPLIAPWGARWTYAGNSETQQMWKMSS